MRSFIVKRKMYSDPNSKYSFWDGKQIQNAKGFKANAANMVNSLVSPGAVTGMVADNAKSKMDAAINDFKETAQDYTPTVKNAFVNPNPQQKQYGIGQAVKEVGTGVGKGLWNWGKKNTKSMKGLIGFGAAMGAGTYGVNRIQRQRDEIESGEREANGMSTGGKLTTGAASLGLGGYTAYKTGKSHDKALNTATEKLAQDKKILAEANSKGLTKISNKASKDIASGKATIDKLNKTRFGMSNKAFKMTRNGLLAGGLVAGAGLLANSTLKQKNNSVFGAAKRIANKSLGGKSWGKAIKDGDWKNIGKAAGAYVNSGVRGASNFFTPGKGGAGNIVRSVENSLKNQGEYGKKAAEFIGKHRTATGLVTAGTVGTGVFNVTNAIGEKGVTKTADMLDKKTSNYIKSREEMNKQ